MELLIIFTTIDPKVGGLQSNRWEFYKLLFSPLFAIIDFACKSYGETRLQVSFPAQIVSATYISRYIPHSSARSDVKQDKHYTLSLLAQSLQA